MLNQLFRTRHSMTEEINSEELIQYVDLDLRDQATEDQTTVLHAQRVDWRHELLRLKRKTETQMTSCKTRVFESHLKMAKGEIPLVEHMDFVATNKVWKTNASRFIQQIESRLLMLKTHD